MKRRGVDWRGPIAIGCLVLLYLLSALIVPLLAPLPAAERSGWAGHYTLLIPENEPTPQVRTALEAAGFDRVITRNTLTVSITNFSGLEQVTLTSLGERLAPMDPRWDPFLRRLPELFVAGERDEYEVLYLGSSLPIGQVRKMVRGAVAEAGDVEGWELAESDARTHIVFLVGFGLVAAATVAFAGRSRFIALAGVVPWVGIVAGGGPGTFVAASLIYFAWAVFAHVGHRYLEHRLQYGSWTAGRRELRYSLLVLGATWALSIGLHPSTSVAARAPVLVGSGGLAALTGALLLRAVRRRRRQDHRLFVPVSLRARPPAISATTRHAAPAAWVTLFVIAVPFVAWLLPDSDIARAPKPAPLPGEARIDFESLQQLGTGDDSELVDIADYVAHRAYQEGFVYGVGYGLPEAGEEVTLSRVRERDGRRVQEPEVVLRYDEAWLDGVLGRSTGIGALLANGNRPSRVVRSPGPGVYSPGTHPARYSLQALVAFLPFLALSIRVLYAAGSGAPIPVPRRKRQAA